MLVRPSVSALALHVRGVDCAAARGCTIHREPCVAPPTTSHAPCHNSFAHAPGTSHRSARVRSNVVKLHCLVPRRRHLDGHWYWSRLVLRVWILAPLKRKDAAMRRHDLAVLAHQPGALGIGVLTLLTPLCIGIGVAFSRDRVGCHAIALGGTAAIFWVWAVYKVVTSGDQDYGAITFLLVIIAALTVLKSEGRSSGSDASYSAKIARVSAATWRLTLTCFVVAANYALVFMLIPGLPPAFQAYLLLGATWWASASLWSFSSLLAHMKALRSSGGMDLEVSDR